ncbi:hypothetical protein Patl1_29109 [Pistacia atlantica]|uniref:Uncharacterized protein n=1 Tax=Pistacia atlantica TaxID=434234 RepID=A0ACC1BD15_9ROSI|nr:hypothetical protein Patl1_29109 [Pistacia atlantica]
MLQDMWNAPPGFRPTKSAPSSPAKPLGVSRTRSESFHAIHKVPVGDTPYVRAKNVQRCGRLDDQIALLRHKLYLIQQGLAFNGKRTKTARSQGKKFQVSVEQEATRLLGNLGWALMQQNNYIEAEDAYRRALTIAPDNNKMCNLGICLMKQGRIAEAKETLRRVKPAVADGPRGVDSHLKAYERAQQMLKDLESEMMNKGGDRVEQSRLFDAFLGSSSIWQPQPCKDHTVLPTTTTANKAQDDFADENTDSNLTVNQIIPPPQQKSVKQQLFPYGNSWQSSQPSKDQKVLPTTKAIKTQDDFADENIDPPQQRSIKQLPPYGNPWNIDAPPFYSSKFLKEPMVKEPIGNQFHEKLKRTRSGNAANSMRVNDTGEYTKPFAIEPEKPENKTRRLSTEEAENKLTEFLPNNEDFEEAIIAAVLGSTNEAGKSDETSNNNAGIFQRKIDKRLKVFQDITLSLSPRA